MPYYNYAICCNCGYPLIAKVLAEDADHQPILAAWKHTETDSIYCWDGSDKTAEPEEDICLILME